MVKHKRKVSLQHNIGWALILLTIALLAGCSSMSRKDGPPPYNVDVSKIPDAVPKAEPLSKYGNKPYYTVFGKRYYVMKSSKNYEEQGVASWYGTKFHSHHTSSGERYNMLAMTAAHKSWPLPTYVQVTNLANGRQVIVKINDRGPFESNRLIDLSYVAAKKLGMLGHGTAHVDVKAIEPNDISLSSLFAKNTAPTTPPPVAHVQTPVHSLRLATHRTTHHDKHFAKNTHGHTAHLVYLQAGAFRNKTHAESLKKRLVAFLSSPVNVHTTQHIYRVQIGPIKDLATATRLSKRLKAMGIHAEKI